MAITTESSRNISNNSYKTQEQTGMIFPESPMPAWVPATSVAIAMLIFLTISFYIRHKKVIKKRQLLMDYFYIIVQFGGLRRKRMVTALCNTNAITLRHLGRSFMISIDNNENSCPFFTDETAFTKTTAPSYSQSNGVSKAKNRLKTPFRRMMSQVEEGHLGSSVHEMLMKFKAKKKRADVPSRNKNTLAPPRRTSLSSIHEDDSYTFSDRSDIETTPRFNQRRNAYVISSLETDTGSTLEISSDVDESELLNAFIEHNKQRRKSSVRRKSQVYQCVETDDDGFHVVGQSSQNLRVLQMGSSKPSQKSFHQNSRQLSRNEPLILIQAASTDVSSSQESDEIPVRCSKGVVVLRRVSKDRSTGDQFFVDEGPVTHNQSKRNSLSTVSYVQSSNVNDYYQHCLQSPKLSDDEFDDKGFFVEDDKQSGKPKSGRGWRKGGWSKKYSPQKTTGPLKKKGARLSLGDIGVANFNFSRRIEESLGSMQEQDSEGSFSARLSKELSDEKSEKNKSSTTWRRLKNVFAGIRWSQSSGPKLKQSKSSTSEDRAKVRYKRKNSGPRKLNRFLSVLTGFRSLPEDKKYSTNSPGGPKGSKSLPMGLDRNSFTVDDFEFQLSLAMDSKHKKRTPRNSTTRADVVGERSNRKVPAKTRSFPDNIFFFQDKESKTTPCLYHLQSDPCGTTSYHRCSERKHKRRSEKSEDHPCCHSISQFDFVHSPSHLSLFSDSNTRLHSCRSTSTPPRSLSPVKKNRGRRYRSLSPLPESRSFQPSSRKGKNVRWYSHSERNSFSERGVAMSPSVRFNVDGCDFQFEKIVSKGSSLGNVTFINPCLKCSCEDLVTTPPPDCREQSIGGNPPSTNVDFVTVDMEQDTNTTCVVLENTGADVPKEECHSIESDSCTTNTEFLSVESISKSSPPANEKTNSSLDSIYFDTFSIPGSPLIVHGALTHPATSTNSPLLESQAFPSSLSATGQPYSVEHALGQNTTQKDPKSVETVEMPNLFSYDKIPPPVNDGSGCPSKSIYDNNTSPVHNETVFVDIDICVENTNDSYDSVPHETSPVIALPHPFSTNPDSPADNNDMWRDSIRMDTNSDSELCDDNNSHVDALLELRKPLLSSIRQSTLEKQASITSEEDMMNLRRLPRFARRSSQLSSPLLPGTRHKDRNENDY